MTFRRGLAPAEGCTTGNRQPNKMKMDMLNSSMVKLTGFGAIIEKEIKNINKRYQNVIIDNYVIMPNHIHLLLTIIDFDDERDKTERASLTQIIGALKSISTRRIREKFKVDKVFQTSFYEHIINNDKDYSNTWDYIHNNPSVWKDDELYTT